MNSATSIIKEKTNITKIEFKKIIDKIALNWELKKHKIKCVNPASKESKIESIYIAKINNLYSLTIKLFESKDPIGQSAKTLL